MRPCLPSICAPLLLLAAGCTPMHWTKADATPEQLSQDSIQCQQDAWRESRQMAWHRFPYGPVPMRDGSGRVFFAWPSSHWGDPLGDPFMEEGRLAQFCMRSKGYQLVPTEKANEASSPKQK